MGDREDRSAADVDMQDGIELVGSRGCFVMVEVGCCRYSCQEVSSRAVSDAKRVDCSKRMLELDSGPAVLFPWDPFKHHESIAS